MAVGNIARAQILGGSPNNVTNCLPLDFILYEKYRSWFIELLIAGFQLLEAEDIPDGFPIWNSKEDTALLGSLIPCVPT